MKRSIRYTAVSILPLVLLFVLFYAMPTNAQQATEKEIGSIEMRGLSNPEASERIILNSGLFKGKKVTLEDFSEAVKRIWRMNIFDNIQLKTIDTSSDLWNIVIEVVENPRLESIVFNGNKEIKNEDLSNLVSFYRSQVVNNNRIRIARRTILNQYLDKGYLLAEVEVDTSVARMPGRLALVFNIVEGEKVKIKKIEFSGNSSFNSSKLRKQFEETKQDGLFTGGDFNRSEYEADKTKLIEYYNKNGFRDSRVLSDSLYYSDDKKHMYILVNVHEGTRYYFRNVSFVGNELYKDEFLSALLDAKKGDVYDKEKLEKNVGDISAAFNDKGHLLANVFPNEVPIGNDSVDVTLDITEGNPVKINLIKISGNTITKEKVIRRELKILPGQTFSRDGIMRSMQDVFRLNFFSDVKPDIGKEIVGDKVDVLFTVVEKSTATANMSAGYSQRDGMIGSLGLAMNNFLGNGQQLSLDWQFGKIFRAFQIGFTEPYLFDSPTMAGFSVYDTRRGGPFYGYDHESKGATLRLGRRLQWPDDRFMGNWYIEYSKNRFFNIVDDQILQNYFIGRGNTTKSSITQVISRDDRRFNPEFHEAGSRVSLSTQFTGDFLGGSENFFKNILKTEWYFPLMNKVVLFENAEFGIIKSLRGDDYISPQDRFYMGGSALSLGTSLRGYKERSVGSVTPDGYPLGGKAMMKFTQELRVQFSPSPTIYALLFAEAGNSWIDASYMDPFGLKRSVGIGLRVFLPMVGMLGMDFGYGFDNYDEDGIRNAKWMPHFQFGRGF